MTYGIGGEGVLISLGKAVLFELARVADNAIKLGNHTNQDFSSSINRNDYSSLGDITLKFFGKEETSKTVKIVFQNYKLRMYVKCRMWVARVVLLLFSLVALIGIVLLFP